LINNLDIFNLNLFDCIHLILTYNPIFVDWNLYW
jgi:hypothetical protein